MIVSQSYLTCPQVVVCVMLCCVTIFVSVAILAYWVTVIDKIPICAIKYD